MNDNRTPPSIVLLGLLSLGVVIWFGMPLIPGIRGTEWVSPIARGTVAGVLLGGWLVWTVIRISIRIRQHRRFLKILVASADLLPGEPFSSALKPHRRLSWWQRIPKSAGDHHRAKTFGEATAPWGSLEQRKVEEREHLKGIFWGTRKIRSETGTKRALNQLPWFLVIGADGAGKSTFLHRAGLPFPVAEIQAQNPLPGSGASRDCRWWFHQDSVLVETPGRYFSHDSIAGTDAEDWDTLLQLLGKLPPASPVRGILVMISADVLMDPERTAHETEHVQRRLTEARDQLGPGVAVHLVLTHLDRIAGFSEYFDNSTPDFRHQPWAVTTSDPEQTRSLPGTLVDRGWNELLRRLDFAALEHLQGERSQTKRYAQFTLFNQLLAFKPRVLDFVTRTFGGTLSDAAPLTSVCLTSAAQGPAKWDWVTAPSAPYFELQGGLQVTQPEFPRGYFVRGVVHQLAVPLAHSDSLTSGMPRRNSKPRRLVLILLMLLSLMVLASWSYNTVQNRRLIQALHGPTKTVMRQISTLGDTPRAAALLPALDALENAVAVFPPYAPLPLRTGLYQGPELRFAAEAAYHRTLRQRFFPALTRALAEQLRNGRLSRHQRRQVLALYSVLDDPKRLDRDAFKAWFRSHWKAADPDTAPVLEGHLETLANLRLPPQQIDYQLLSGRR